MGKFGQSVHSKAGRKKIGKALVRGALLPGSNMFKGALKGAKKLHERLKKGGPHG